MIGGVQLSRRVFVALSAGTLAAVLGRARGKEGGAPVVVELFTSQGCSSCLAADAFLDELSRASGVIALSLNVDYWDYLGWRDTLGSPECARRQQDYARRRGDGLIYTPQMIINGRLQIPGFDRQSVLRATAKEGSRGRADAVDVLIDERGRELAIHIATTPSDRLRQESTVFGS